MNLLQTLHNNLAIIKSSKKVFLAFLTASVFLYLIFYIYYKNGREERLQDFRGQLVSVATLKAHQLEKWRNERISDARFILNDEGIAFKLIENIRDKDAPVPPWMLSMYNNGNYQQIAFLDNNMKNIINLPKESPMKINDYTKRLMQEAIQKKTVIFSEPFNDDTGMTLLDLIVPISMKKASSGGFIGWIILRIDLQKGISSLFYQWPLLKDSYESIIATKDNDYITYLYHLKHPHIKPSKLKLKIDDKNIKDLQGDINYRATFFTIDQRGKEVITASKTISDTSWIVITKIDKDDVMSPFIHRSILILFLITTLLSTSFVYLLLFLSSKEKEMQITLYKEKIDKLNREKENETKILHLNRLYSVLSAINRMIVRAYGEKAILENTCKILVHIGGFKLAWVGVVDKETKSVIPKVFYGLNDGYLDNINISIDPESPYSKGPTGIALREGRYNVCNDILNDENMKPWQIKAEERDFRSSGAFPIIVKGDLYGCINLYSSEVDFFNHSEIELCLEIANDVAFAIDRIREMNLRKKAEQQLRKFNEELEQRIKREVEKSREKDFILMRQSRCVLIAELMNRIAHQWRQPLNAVGLVLQNIENLCECYNENKEIINQNITLGMNKILDLSATIDNFKNFFMPDTEKTIFPINESIETAINLLNDTLKENHITLESNCQQAQIMINGFKKELAQVIVNIISNAMEVSLERNINDAIIKLECEVVDGMASIKITDNAGGVDEGIIDKIFEPYFTTKFEAEGVGLGLYMSKMMIERNMVGTLTARNVDGGAQFVILLPIVSR